MLYQLHYQHRNNKTDFIAQNEFSDLTDGKEYSEFRKWFDEVRESHPLPDKCVWMICNETSPQFMWAEENTD